MAKVRNHVKGGKNHLKHGGKPNQNSTKRVFFFLFPFTLIGRFTLAIIRAFKKGYNNFLSAIVKSLEFIGRTAQYLIKIPFGIVKFLFNSLLLVLETIGKFVVFLLVFAIRLPSLPFLVVWDLWLILTHPVIRKQKIRYFKKSFREDWKKIIFFFQCTKSSWARFNRNLVKNPDPGVQVCYAFVRTPIRFLLTFIIIFSSIFNFYFWVLKDLPSPYRLKAAPALSTKIYARDCQTLLYKVYRDQNRTLIPLDQIPQIVKQATIAVEDKEFYHHHGYSITGILRAARNNFKSKKLQGGSTITQQLIKNTVLSPERTWERKIKELVLSLQAELIFSKDQILQMYLNEVAYGGQAYGIEEASQMYFGKSVKDIDLSQAAFLAGLPAAPSKYSPYLVDMKTAKERQKDVLTQMVKAGFLAPDQAKEAYKKELKILPPNVPIIAPHFVMYAKEQLSKQFGPRTVEEGGLSVCTTLDPQIQAMAEKVVQEEVEKIKIPYRVNNGAALATNPKTGEILAMVGSVDYWDEGNDGNVNVTDRPRQPGSSIKIVNYSYALAWAGYKPTTILMDTPVSYTSPWEVYSPVNYDGKFRGPVTLRSALAMSLNVPAVKVLNSYGPDKMLEQGKKMGITTWDNLKNYGLSLTLGAAEVKMTDMATVYGTIANLGKRVDITPFRKIIDNEGKVLVDIDKKESGLALAKKAEAAEADNPQVVPELVAYQLIDILSDNVARTPEFGPRSSLYIPDKKVAVKTGTSNNFRDNWTLGFTPNLLVAAWVGNNDNTPMSGIASGITGAAPIWNRIMVQLIEDLGAEPFATPSGLVKVKICATNGLLTCKGCPQEKEEFFVPGTEPTKACSFSQDPCAALQAKMQKEGKSQEEINQACAACKEASKKPKPSASP